MQESAAALDSLTNADFCIAGKSGRNHLETIVRAGRGSKKGALAG